MQAAANAQRAAMAKAESDMRRREDEFEFVMANRASNGTVIEGEFEVLGEQKMLGKE